MNLAITCIAWVESIIKNEIEKLWYKVIETIDRMVYFTWDDSSIARMNLWSRVGNKVYIELKRGKVRDFDDLFDILSDSKLIKYLWENNPIIVDAVSIKSDLTSIPAIQKTSKKAIITNLTGSKDRFYFEDDKLPKIELLIFINWYDCRILLNTSWEALHKRWYRVKWHDAPIKESLAAALVILSWWSFKKPFFDFFCWSWTIPIEAALLAKNIAPGSIWRNFAFENFSWYDKKYLEEAKIEASNKVFTKGNYEIHWFDIDEDNIVASQDNAYKAWVSDIIDFKVKNFLEENSQNTYLWTIVSNPPYWLRLNPEDIIDIYKWIARLFRNNIDLNWGIITSFEEFDDLINLKNFKKRKLYNWNEKCYFYKKV